MNGSASSLDVRCSAEVAGLPGLDWQQHRHPWIQATVLGETNPSGLSQLPGRSLAVGEHRNPLCCCSTGQRGLQRKTFNSLSCLPVSPLSCVLGEPDVWGTGPGHYPSDASVKSSIPALLLAVNPRGARGQPQVIHSLPCQGHLCSSVPLWFSLPTALNMSPEAEVVPQLSRRC